MQIPDLSSECIYKAVRSSGKGGQNVNKVSSKVELYFTLQNSVLLNAVQKETIHKKLGNRINEEGILRIVCEEDRSQLRNKKNATEKLHALIEKALQPVKKRVPTKTPKEAKRKRLVSKRMQSLKKELRKKPEGE